MHSVCLHFWTGMSKIHCKYFVHVHNGVSRLQLVSVRVGFITGEAWQERSVSFTPSNQTLINIQYGDTRARSFQPMMWWLCPNTLISRVGFVSQKRDKGKSKGFWLCLPSTHVQFVFQIGNESVSTDCLCCRFKSTYSLCKIIHSFLIC